MASPAATAKMPISVANRKAPTAGFTLLELLVVLAIAGLLAALVPPAFNQMLEASRYRATVRDVLASLHQARAQALVQGRPQQFVFDAAGRRFTHADAPWQAIPESVKLSMVAGEGVAADGLLAIEFFPVGGATGGTVLLCRNAGSGMVLQVDWLTGQITQQALTGPVNGVSCG